MNLTTRIEKRRLLRCDCQTCKAAHPSFWGFPERLAVGTCDLCGRDGRVTQPPESTMRYPSIVSYLPEVIAEFFGTREICQYCRTRIVGVVCEDLRMCFGVSCDAALKLGLAMWCVVFLQQHFYWGKFMERDCCKGNGLHVRRGTIK